MHNTIVHISHSGQVLLKHRRNYRASTDFFFLDQELKRKYLALLPPQQIIDICLTFDVHVPPYVKSTIWPHDINAAIAALDTTASSSNTNTTQNVLGKPVPVMDSLRSSPSTEQPPTVKEVGPPTEPQPPDKGPSLAPVPSAASTSPSTASPSPVQGTQSSPPVVSEPVRSVPPPPVQQLHPHPQPTFPHQPYGFSPSTAYPHNPYYPTHSTAYAYPHSAYAPYAPIQSGYHHPHVLPAYPTPSTYNNLMPLPPPPEGVNADDLPSYEEMIVEALSSTTDPEGYAPKDLFTWMASRYPLQSNFRPSASQALQKAYRRGRFEKSSGGKYRLNPTWDGGNVRASLFQLTYIQLTVYFIIQTLRRSTRRPQTQNSLSSGPPAPASPFTKTPLVHHHQQTPTAAAGPPFPSYGYAYPRMGYPGVPPQPQPAPAASSPSAKPSPDHDGNSVDAYEAAQTILKAINFGSLLQLPVEGSDDSRGADEHQPQHSGLETLLSHVQAALASSTAGTTAAGPLPVAEPAEPATLTNPGTAVEPRAELQAQLALLAAHLAELSQTEEATSTLQDAPPLPPVPTLVPTHDPPPQISPVTPVIADINPSETQNDDDNDDSDDDDMEEII
jgi:hypothetical protein